MNTQNIPVKKPLAGLFVLILIGIFTLSGDLYAQRDPDSLVCLEIRGKIKKTKLFAGDDYKVELISDTVVVDSAFLGPGKSFSFHLRKNTYYGIRISKKGHLPRVISICTDLPPSKRFDRFYKFYFDTELIEETEYANLNHDALDFPIAIISFDQKLRCFYYSEKYTTTIKQKLYAAETASR